MRVLVTDSHVKHALAAIRDLGRHKAEVFCTSEAPFNPSAFSIYCKKNFRIPKYMNENDLLDFYKNLISEYKIDVVLPIGYKSNLFFSKFLNDFRKITKVPVVDYEKMLLASDKKKTYEFANKVGVPIPKTAIVSKIDALKRYKFDFPVVIKSVKEMMGKKVIYANSKDELRTALNEKLQYCPQIVQEYVSGPTRGFFALYNNGKIIASFQHERIRDYPYSGGVSSCAISIYDEKLQEIGEKILDRLKWHGVAMLEFKYDMKNKMYKLIEMNPKFWGPWILQLCLE